MPRSRMARAHLAVGASVLLVLAVGACSRLTFVRPNLSRGHYRQTAEEVHIRPGSGSRDSVYNLVQVAQQRLISGSPESALEASGKALRINPKSAEAHSLYALSLDALGRTRESGSHHRQAAELAPTQGGMLNNYGIWLCTNGEPAQSLSWFDRAVDAPGYETPESALSNAADCAVRAGQPARGERDARRVLEANPSNPVALMALARLNYAAGRGLEARAFMERRLASAAADADALQLASQIEQLLGDTAASTRYVHRLRAEFPPAPRSAQPGGKP